MLKESFKIYKAISEGLINLADRFFEMDYLAAAKGLEIYKESIVASERLQVCAHACSALKPVIHLTNVAALASSTSSSQVPCCLRGGCLHQVKVHGQTMRCLLHWICGKPLQLTTGVT